MKGRIIPEIESIRDVTNDFPVTGFWIIMAAIAIFLIILFLLTLT